MRLFWLLLPLAVVACSRTKEPTVSPLFDDDSSGVPDADADTDSDTNADSDTDTDLRTVNGFTWCAAGGASSDGTYTHAGCFAPVDMAPGATATDSTFTLMSGPLYRVAP